MQGPARHVYHLVYLAVDVACYTALQRGSPGAACCYPEVYGQTDTSLELVYDELALS